MFKLDFCVPILYTICKEKHYYIIYARANIDLFSFRILAMIKFLRESKSGHKVINSFFALRHNSKGFPQMYVSIDYNHNNYEYLINAKLFFGLFSLNRIFRGWRP